MASEKQQHYILIDSNNPGSPQAKKLFALAVSQYTAGQTVPGGSSNFIPVYFSDPQLKNWLDKNNISMSLAKLDDSTWRVNVQLSQDVLLTRHSANIRKNESVLKGGYGSVIIAEKKIKLEDDTAELLKSKKNKRAYKTIMIDPDEYATAMNRSREKEYLDSWLKKIYNEIKFNQLCSQQSIEYRFSISHENTLQATLNLPAIEGKNLKEILSADDFKNKSLLFCLQIAVSAAKASEYMSSELGIVHNDIKPANMVRDEVTGKVKIVDFGGAENKDELMYEILSTHAYRPKEKFVVDTNGLIAKSSMDVYSFGVILAEILLGLKDLNKIRYQNIHAKIDEAAESISLPEEIKSGLVKFIKQCTADNPEDRPDFSRILESLKQLRTYVLKKTEIKPEKTSPKPPQKNNTARKSRELSMHSFEEFKQNAFLDIQREKLRSLKAQIYKTDYWGNVGIGFFGSKTPDGIQKLRNLLPQAENIDGLDKGCLPQKFEEIRTLLETKKEPYVGYSRRLPVTQEFYTRQSDEFEVIKTQTRLLENNPRAKTKATK